MGVCPGVSGIFKCEGSILSASAGFDVAVAKMSNVDTQCGSLRNIGLLMLSNFLMRGLSSSVPTCAIAAIAASDASYRHMGN